MLTGCAGHQPPSEPDNICSIFSEKKAWKNALYDVEKKWGVPPYVTASIIYQESSFRHNARPGPKSVLFGMNVGRQSSAYGYAQALDATWADYQKETGNWRSRRDNFNDAVDFIGWFNHKTNKINKVSKASAKNLYYNYHEGWGGFRKGTHKKKAFLVKAASSVEKRAARYKSQMTQCVLNGSGKEVLFSIFG